MCLFESDVPMYFGGTNDAPAAYVEVNVFGSSVPKSAWQKLTPAIMDALQDTLQIPADRTYISKVPPCKRRKPQASLLET